MTELMSGFEAQKQGTYRGGAVCMDGVDSTFHTDLSCAAPQKAKPAAPRTSKVNQPAQKESDMQISGVRYEKVAALRAAIENGTYYVSAEALADKLIETLLR